MRGLKWVLEKGFAAFSNANSMKMRCWSVWDTSRIFGFALHESSRLLMLDVSYRTGLQPSKMAENIDFARNFFSSRKKITAALSNRPEQRAGRHMPALLLMLSRRLRKRTLRRSWALRQGFGIGDLPMGADRSGIHSRAAQRSCRSN